jgi:DNA-directed RNA polymerase subunit RPC12/RpoP
MVTKCSTCGAELRNVPEFLRDAARWECQSCIKRCLLPRKPKNTINQIYHARLPLLPDAIARIKLATMMEVDNEANPTY